MQEGLKVVVERPSDSTRVNDIKIVHTSILSVLDTTFTVRGYSKYLFDIKTMTSIGLDKLKVSLDC